MEITGRLTADAEIRTTKDKKQIVTFTVAVNDTYKAKDGERKEVTEFISCSYWLSSKIANVLSKSAIVNVSGRIYLNEYTGRDGNKYANLAFHANAIKIISTARKRNDVILTPAATGTVKDDLPF